MFINVSLFLYLFHLFLCFSFYDVFIEGAEEVTDRAEHAGYVLSDVAESIRITGFTVMYFLALVVACVLPLAAL